MLQRKHDEEKLPVVRLAVVIAFVIPLMSVANALGQPSPTPPRQSKGMEIFVAPDGDDNNPGTLDEPLATLAGARDKIRNIKASSGLPQGGITVYFRGGQYHMTDMVTFRQEDSGTADEPITYTAYPGETPLFTGGLYFSGRNLTRPSGMLAARLPSAARNNCWSINLFENGFAPDDLDYASPRWTTSEYGALRMAIYVDDIPLHMARYPNKVPGLYPGNHYHDYVYLEDGGKWIDGRDSGKTAHPAFQVSPEIAERMATWQNYDDILVGGMLSYTYLHEANLIHSYDTSTRTIELSKNLRHPDDAERTPMQGRYYFQNVLEELDAPGEYYIDRTSGTLIFYAPDGAALGNDAIKIPKLNTENMIECLDASYLTFSGLTMELNKGNGMHIWFGSHVTVDGCTIRNVSDTGFYVGYASEEAMYIIEHYGQYGVFPPDESTAEMNGFNHTIKNCNVYNAGDRGANLAAGQISSRKSGHLLFENNMVINTGFIGNWGGVDANGVGISLLRNTVAFTPAFGMGIDGPDCIAAYNEIYDVICDPAQNESSALGLHHSNLNWNLVIHDNYIHDIQRTPVRPWETFTDNTPNRLALDVIGNGPGAKIYRNVVYNAPIGMSMPDNAIFPSTYANNIFIDAMLPVLSYDLTYGDYYKNFTFEKLITESMMVATQVYVTGIYKTAWRDVYPEYYDFFEYYLNQKTDITQPMSPVYNNICVNINVPRILVAPQSSWGPMPPDDEITPDPVYGRYGNNRYLISDPGFVDYANGNVQLTQAAADALGVEWIDLSVIGAQRTSEPLLPIQPSNTQSPDKLSATGNNHLLPYLIVLAVLVVGMGAMLASRYMRSRR